MLFLYREIHSKSDLFIFCGHGAGEKMFSKDTMNFIQSNQGPNVMLWGCSSGKLSGRGVFDPTGAAIRHLQCGAKFVIGNLWDVTDKDLDKLSIDCMTKSLELDGGKDDTKSVSEALAIARDVCKMKYAVGSAAIVYGIPMICKIYA